MPPTLSPASLSAVVVVSTMLVGCAMDSTMPSSTAQKKESDPSGFSFWIDRQ